MENINIQGPPSEVHECDNNKDQIPFSGNMESAVQASIDANLTRGVCTPTEKSKVQEFELHRSNYVNRDVLANDNYEVTSLENCKEMNEWVTLECFLSNLSECQIVGNKLKSFFSDESQHSKWEEFRSMAKTEMANEECSQRLKRMELQESDEEEDVTMDELPNQDGVVRKVEMFEEIHETKKQKRQIQWGPMQRMERPRRHPVDGKTMLQRAMELKEYQRGKGTKPILLTTYESSECFITKANYVNMSLGSNPEMVNNNVKLMINRDLAGREKFQEQNPEINLPTDLKIELSMEDFPSLGKQTDTLTPSPLKELDNDSWVKITSKGLKPSTSTNVNNDRSNLEC